MKYIIDINTPYKTASTLLTLVCIDNIGETLPVALQNSNVPGTLDVAKLPEFKLSDSSIAICKRHSVNKIQGETNLRIINVNIERPFNEIIISYCNHKSDGNITYTWLIGNLHLIVFKSWETKVLQCFCRDATISIKHADLKNTPELVLRTVLKHVGKDLKIGSENLTSIADNMNVRYLQGRTNHNPSFFNRRHVNVVVNLFILGLGGIGQFLWLCLPKKVNEKILYKIRCSYQ